MSFTGCEVIGCNSGSPAFAANGEVPVIIQGGFKGDIINAMKSFEAMLLMVSGSMIEKEEMSRYNFTFMYR